VPLPKVLVEESAAERVREVKARPAGKLLVHEIYRSLQGEGTRAGVPCTFVRMSGCHLRCRYCDTAHAFHEGEARDVDEVVAAVAAEGNALVLITGGEPLLQPESLALMTALADAGHEVLLETSGGVTTKGVDERVVVILDVKTPGSGEAEANVWSNLERLRATDELKFVITSEADYRWAVEQVEARGLADMAQVLFSPAFDDELGLSPTDLADWMVRDRVAARLNLQIHKVLWGDKRGV
jgi:7-carboxy-7-deazaguanine synthase